MLNNFRIVLIPYELFEIHDFQLFVYTTYFALKLNIGMDGVLIPL